jgi:predicted RNA binding protein YcfA (HicA-like mRNA interferase family)
LSQLPQVTGERLLRAFQKAGFVLKRQKGSHAIVVHPQYPLRRAIIPLHGSKPVKPGTLHAILKGAEITAEDLKNLL